MEGLLHSFAHQTLATTDANRSLQVDAKCMMHNNLAIVLRTVSHQLRGNLGVVLHGKSNVCERPQSKDGDLSRMRQYHLCNESGCWCLNRYSLQIAM